MPALILLLLHFVLSFISACLGIIRFFFRLAKFCGKEIKVKVLILLMYCFVFFQKSKRDSAGVLYG